MITIRELQQTIKDLVIPGKGILAADESINTIKKRFQAIQVESTEENRRLYRTILLTTPELNKYISGVILFEETLIQQTKEGIFLPNVLTNQGITPGIKVDKGLSEFESSPQEKITAGLDGLAERITEYRKMGIRFAKWRAAFHISGELTPSDLAIQTNAILLARYAAICQTHGIVPIVEPEVMMNGNHSIEHCAEVTEKILSIVFYQLHRYKVMLEYIILKPNMIITGTDYKPQASIEAVAKETIKVLLNTVPAAVPSINFLSGGQDYQIATTHLNEISKFGPHPWNISFSYGRALQEPALKAWRGNAKNELAAQQALLKRAKLNSIATLGEYRMSMEEQ